MPLVIGEYKFLILFVARWYLSAIFLAPLRALLLGRAELVEVVELAAGEQAAAPLTVRFQAGSLNAPSSMPLAFFRCARSCLELARVLCRRRRIIDEFRDIDRFVGNQVLRVII